MRVIRCKVDEADAIRLAHAHNGVRVDINVDAGARLPACVPAPDLHSDKGTAREAWPRLLRQYLYFCTSKASKFEYLGAASPRRRAQREARQAGRHSR